MLDCVAILKSPSVFPHRPPGNNSLRFHTKYCVFWSNLNLKKIARSIVFFKRLTALTHIIQEDDSAQNEHTHAYTEDTGHQLVGLVVLVLNENTQIQQIRWRTTKQGNYSRHY